MSENIWSSGNSRERSDAIHDSLTISKSMYRPLFAKIDAIVNKDQEQETGVIEDESSSETENSTVKDSSRGNITVGELRDRSRALLEKVLVKNGYPKEMLEDTNFSAALAKAIVSGAEIVSKKTGRAWVERAIPEEAPAFVRPDRLKIGDNVQLLNWTPLGVHGAVVDLYPRGTVTKVYQTKCLLTKEPFTLSCMPKEDVSFEEEDRILGVELDGKGPYPLKDDTATPFPYLTKDSTVVLRYPIMARPSGETEHFDPMVV